ncbi:MAG: hypothetical protein GXP25_17460 [Planctomycetes bacterium]|nr:hypothetical protein [Planctomycetota bacterium]
MPQVLPELNEQGVKDKPALGIERGVRSDCQAGLRGMPSHPALLVIVTHLITAAAGPR